MGREHYAMALLFRLAVLVVLLALREGLSCQAGEHWPQFRGPEARGVASGPNLPDRWSATENIAWKTDIPGRGGRRPSCGRIGSFSRPR